MSGHVRNKSIDVSNYYFQIRVIVVQFLLDIVRCYCRCTDLNGKVGGHVRNKSKDVFYYYFQVGVRVVVPLDFYIG